jgi:hypothetical protein
MGWLRAIWSELFGLFVDDGVYAGAILAWIVLCWLVLPRLPVAPALPPLILFAGLAAILLAGALRRT